MKTCKKLILVSTLCSVSVAGAATGTLDGAPLLCAASKVVVCSEGGVCVAGMPEEVDLPRFVSVDISRRQISGAWPPDGQRISRVDSMQTLEDRIILQGVDTNVPWSAAVDRKSGRLVATQARKDISFTVFGACMPK
ncbi:MAG: hypothetical protein GY703_05635 [Gammaproteobacteria bacterium]|nr:hypothetical protein [Gammaproteobacteria bacterium]